MSREKWNWDRSCSKRIVKNSKKNNNLILKVQHRFKSERHNVFTEEIKKITLSSNDDKRMKSIDLIKTCERAKI